MLVFVQMYLWIIYSVQRLTCVSTIVIELSVSVLRFGV